jgi:CxxC motif-containing protein
MKSLTCIICPIGCELTLQKQGDGWSVRGNLCPKGRDFAVREMENPMRMVCSTVKTSLPGIRRLSVRTDKEVPLSMIRDVMDQIRGIVLDHPVHIGEVLIEHVCETESNIIATTDAFDALGDDTTVKSYRRNPSCLRETTMSLSRNGMRKPPRKTHTDRY